MVRPALVRTIAGLGRIVNRVRCGSAWFGQILSTVRARALPDVTLRRVPFTVAEAREAGMRWRDLQTRHWTRISHGQYAWAGLPQDVRLKLLAVSLRMARRYAFSGVTAAWLLGSTAHGANWSR